MTAVTYHRYGFLDSLVFREVARPVVKDGEVRVRVHAAAVHVGDCYGVGGAPFAMRLKTGAGRRGRRPGEAQATHVEPSEPMDVRGFLACDTAVRLVKGYDAMSDLSYAVGLPDLGKQYDRLGTQAYRGCQSVHQLATTILPRRGQT